MHSSVFYSGFVLQTKVTAASDSDSDPAIIDMSTNAKLAMVESEVCIHTIVLILWWKYFTMYMYIDIL